jgi:ClpP class serine protease
MQCQIIDWKKKQNEAFKAIYEEFSKLINSEREKMEAEIVRIREMYAKGVKHLEEMREERVRTLRDNGAEI